MRLEKKGEQVWTRVREGERGCTSASPGAQRLALLHAVCGEHHAALLRHRCDHVPHLPSGEGIHACHPQDIHGDVVRNDDGAHLCIVIDKACDQYVILHYAVNNGVIMTAHYYTWYSKNGSIPF